MKNYVILGVFLIILLVPTAFGSSSCPCGRPNTDPGIITGFDCSVGGNDNVSFHVESQPIFGGAYKMLALKDFKGDSLAARNLAVTVSINGQERYLVVSDENGYFEFDLSEFGEYEIRGGDATFSFNITDPTAGNEVNETGKPEDQIGENVSEEAVGEQTEESDSDQAVLVDESDPAEVVEHRPADKTNKSGDFPYIYIIILIVAIVAIMIYMKKK